MDRGERAKVVVSDLNEPGAKALASELGHNGMGVKLDVTDQASNDAMVAAAAVSHFGGIDILVNNAGIFDLADIIEMRAHGAPGRDWRPCDVPRQRRRRLYRRADLQHRRRQLDELSDEIDPHDR